MNGKVLEDIIHKRLCNDKHNTKDCRYFFSVGENIKYNVGKKVYEIDNIAIRVNKHGKKYALIFEDKLSNKRKCKAHQQLRRHYQYITERTDVDKVYLFYVHDYYKPHHKKFPEYKINRYIPTKGLLK